MSVLVYTENWDGKFKKLTFELVSYANELAKNMNTSVTAVSIGNVAEDELKKLGTYGAAKVLSFNDNRAANLVNQAYSSVITQAAQRENANIVVFANNFTGKAVAPRVAVKLNAGVASGAVTIPDSYEPFTVSTRAFSGNAFSKVTVKSPQKVVTLNQNSFDIIETGSEAAIENFTPELKDEDFRTEVKDVNKVTDKILLTDAEVVVSGGRGMKGADFWKPIEELAELLGGATACSRPVSDEGWRPHEEHTGQTGKIIGPNLYFAFGISGAIRHLAGASASKCIMAINKDEEAPIFQAADYGIIGDVHKVLPELVTAIREFKASN